MGNTPSIPPPLVSINAPGNDVLVPYGTSLYAYPPRTPGYHAAHSHCGHGPGACQRATCPDARGPIFSKVGTTPGRARHGHAEPDLRICAHSDQSSSTDLGEVPMRRRDSKQNGRRRGEPGPYDGPRPSSAPVGYAGLRGGQGQPGMYAGADEMGMNGLVPYVRMYPGAYPQGPNMSPLPPQYASHESMPGYAGMGGARNGNVYPSHPPRQPPPSTSSSSSSSKVRSRHLPSAIQAAIDEAIQKSIGAGGPRKSLGRSKTSPATLAKDSDTWGDGIDTCICTTNCKCRKGERAVKWYEGMAKIGGEEVPVRAKLNTRYVLKDDIGKDCGDHSGCKKKTSPSSKSSRSSSGSDTEVSRSKSSRKKSKKNAKKAAKDDALNDLQAELDRMRQAAALKQGGPYGPSPFAGYNPGSPEGYDPETMKRMMEMRDSRRMGRVAGMDPMGRMQGTYDPMSTRNPRLSRMPPNPGMRLQAQNDGYMEHHEEMGDASPLNPYARPSAIRSKGKNQASMPPRRRPRFGLRKESDSDSELSTSSRGRDGKKGGMMSRRPRRSRAFELDDTDVSLAPRSQSLMKGFCSDGDEDPAMCNLQKRGDGGINGSSSPRTGWPRISPSGRRGGVRKGRAAGKQARVETDDDEDC